MRKMTARNANKKLATIPFGWNIFEMNLTVGGLLGYSSVNSTVNLKVPAKSRTTRSIKSNAVGQYRR